MPQDRFAALPYRACVGAMLVNAAGHVFVGRRIDNQEGDWWQMPQGGVDKGEDVEAALYRELWEETGVGRDCAQIVSRAREELLYDLPESLIGTLWGGRYRGQRQTWFLVHFTGTDDAIDLNAHRPPEFCAWKWVEPDLLPKLIVPFKKSVYAAVLDEFRKLL